MKSTTRDTTKKVPKITEFETSDIEDVRIIIKAKGKNFSIIPNRSTITDEEAKQVRILMLSTILPYHFVVSTALEDLK